MNPIFRSLIGATNKPYRKKLIYLESTGTQYIDTGIAATADIKISVGIYSSLFGTSDNVSIYGSRTSASANDNFGLINFSNTKRFRFDRGSYNLAASSDVISSNTYYEVTRDGADNYVNGVLVSTCTSTFTPNSNLPIYLFGINQSNTVNFLNAKFRLYFCKIYTNSTLVQYLIPVLDRNNVPCMYDKVSGKLFYNQGTGTFNYN